jgi:hypothetical protein
MFVTTLSLKIHINFIPRIKLPKTNCSPPNFYLPTQEKITPLYISPNLAQNFLSGRLWRLYPSSLTKGTSVEGDF